MKTRFLVYILISFFLISAVNSSGYTEKKDIGKLSSLKKHDPIIISSNEQFSVFPGNGTKNDPYRIENYIITTAYLFGIYIKGTTVNFVIQNCFINAGQSRSAIFLSFIANGTATIRNNTIVQSYNGIEVVYSDSCTIENNTITNNENSGIKLSSSHRSTVVSNFIKNNGEHGIFLDIANNCLVYNNTIEDNTGYGIYSVYSYYSNFSSNRLTSDVIVFYDQEIFMYESCFFQDNFVNGLKAAFIVSEENKMIGGSLGYLMLVNSTNLLLYNLSINKADIGIYIYKSENIQIANSSISYSYIDAVTISSSSNIVLAENIFSYSSRTGIRVRSSTNLHVNNNLIYRNYYGINFEDSSNSSIVSNTFEQNINYAILLGANTSKIFVFDNLFINNNFLGNSQAYDEGTENSWFNEETREGNYWSDYDKEGDYEIDGAAHSYDLYPVGREDMTTTPFSLTLFLFHFLLLTFIQNLIKRKKANQKN